METTRWIDKEGKRGGTNLPLSLGVHGGHMRQRPWGVSPAEGRKRWKEGICLLLRLVLLVDSVSPCSTAGLFSFSFFPFCLLPLLPLVLFFSLPDTFVRSTCFFTSSLFYPPTPHFSFPAFFSHDGRWRSWSHHDGESARRRPNQIMKGSNIYLYGVYRWSFSPGPDGCFLFRGDGWARQVRFLFSGGRADWACVVRGV